MEIKINKLFIKKAAGIKKPNDNVVKELVKRKKLELAISIALKKLEEDGYESYDKVPKDLKNKYTVSIKDVPKEKIEESTKKIIEENTVHTYQLLSLDKYPILVNLIEAKANEITRPNSVIFLSNIDFKEVLKLCKFEPSTKVIHIYVDSNTILCTIRVPEKEELDEALKENVITLEMYDNLIKLIPNDTSN
jgi:hypothetical protein